MKNTDYRRLQRVLPFVLSLALLGSPLLEAGVLLFEGFETDGLNTRYFATDTFTDGSDDYFIRTDGFTEASGIPAYSGFSGDYFWAAEDIDATENPSGLGLLDFTGIDLAGFPEITLSLDMGAGSASDFDSVDDFVLVQYRIDAGSWSTALAFQNDGSTFNASLRQDLDLDGIGEGLLLGLEFQTFTSMAIPTGGSLLDLRIDTLMNGGGEAIAFDNIRVTGVPEPSHLTLVLGLVVSLAVFLKRRFLTGREIESQA